MTATDTPTPAPVERLAYSTAELAEALGCSRQHIHNLLARGALPSVKLGARRLIPRAAVEKLLAGELDEASS